MVRCYQGRRRVRQQVLKPGEDFAFSGHLTRLTIDTGQKVETVDWPTCPSWARGIGRDRYGLFVEVTVQGVEFVMRWIPPGEFMMGSPGDEPERFNDEGPQHLVQFTHGFWLAETACTQALWQAVMGENPSEFKGDELPVENVSWTDAQKFIEQANRIHPGLALRLPSEAEWEYGCRAGTSMPFWFGTELITDRANYDGRSPYADGKKGERRGKTVEVKRFQPNPWGLYQVHGNVWEWCADPWHDNYEGAPDDGRAWEKDGDSERAVLRGGSWFNLGRRLRSAFRGRDHRDFAGIIGDFGFRLARGPESPGAAGGRGRRGSQAERGTSAASATTGPARAGNEQLRGA
ncbi:MAG TPA: formylglycine-generating enzyme family protein [Desulfobulbus sp.]|nr:formylglycine-generating enzyme family protein [Desulfobulbus sp.]